MRCNSDRIQNSSGELSPTVRPAPVLPSQALFSALWQTGGGGAAADGATHSLAKQTWCRWTSLLTSSDAESRALASSGLLRRYTAPSGSGTAAGPTSSLRRLALVRFRRRVLSLLRLSRAPGTTPIGASYKAGYASTCLELSAPAGWWLCVGGRRRVSAAVEA